jgi:hypothetical protein
MSYQEKKTIVTVLTGLLILAAYCIYTIDKVKSGVVAPDDLKFWASAMLIFIGIGIVAMIVILIVFHILLSISIAVKDQLQNGKCNDKEIEKNIELEMVEDEMDKLIGLKSLRIGYAVGGAGFIAALISVVLNYPPAVMINIIFVSVSIGSVAEGIAQLYFYRRGVRNG